MASRLIFDKAALQVIVLARGKGERLRPFTLGRPKALCPICNLSILGRLVANLAKDGFPSVTLSLPSLLPPDWADTTRRFPRQIEIVPAIGDKPAGGSFIAARQCLNEQSDRILVIYGDSFLKANLQQLVRRHIGYNREHGAIATVLYHRPKDRFTPDDHGRTYHGIMQCAPNGEVIRFVEKPPVEMVRSPFDLANAAAFVVERAIFTGSKFPKAADFSKDVFEPAVNQRLAKVYGAFIGSAGYRHDLGTPERLFEANMNVLGGCWDAPLPGRECSPGIWVESGVTRRGARIVAPAVVGCGAHLGVDSTVGPMAVVGEGCTIGRGASVQRSVLMARTRIGNNARVENCFVGSDSTIESDTQLPPGSFLGDFTRIGNTNDQDR